MRVGCARVEGDKDEDDIDDLEHEFNFSRDRAAADAAHNGYYQSAYDYDLSPQDSHRQPQIPLLTNGQMADDIPPDTHALVPAYMSYSGSDGGKRVHPFPFPDPSAPSYTLDEIEERTK
ncbi:hypothetical protein ACFE04_018165 [Oxalis oulophora]